jgi:hypothetical protein
VWDKAWAKQVINDGQIDAFKRQCQGIFLREFPGVNLNGPQVRTSFQDGFKNQPPHTKLL